MDMWYERDGDLPFRSEWDTYVEEHVDGQSVPHGGEYGAAGNPQQSAMDGASFVERVERDHARPEAHGVVAHRPTRPTQVPEAPQLDPIPLQAWFSDEPLLNLDTPSNAFAREDSTDNAIRFVPQLATHRPSAFRRTRLNSETSNTQGRKVRFAQDTKEPDDSSSNSGGSTPAQAENIAVIPASPPVIPPFEAPGTYASSSPDNVRDPVFHHRPQDPYFTYPRPPAFFQPPVIPHTSPVIPYAYIQTPSIRNTPGHSYGSVGSPTAASLRSLSTAWSRDFATGYTVSSDDDGSDILEQSVKDPNVDDQTSAATAPIPANSKVNMFDLYLEHTAPEDHEIIKTWNNDLDSILLFATLFSAVLTTFVVESSHNLQPDKSVEFLRAILVEIRTERGQQTVPSLAIPSSPSVSSSGVRVNAYWFSSLVISLAAALIAILVKQCINYLFAGLSPVPSERARHRQYRIDGMERWKLPAIISCLPVFLHISLLLFFVGLVEFAWDLNLLVGILVAILASAASMIYLASNVIAYMYPECPYKTSVTFLIEQGITIALLVSMRCSVSLNATLARGRTWLRQLYRTAQAVPRNLSSVLTSRSLLDLPRTGTFVHTGHSTAGARRTAQVLSLRHQDEKYIQQHKTVLDARIIRWFLLNERRLPNPQSLSCILREFPHLILHRRLLIKDGAFDFLERFFIANCTAEFSTLPTSHQNEVIHSITMISTLESEAEIDGPEFAANVLQHQSVPLRTVPYIGVRAVDLGTANPQPASSPLSKAGAQLVSSLVQELPTLPLLLASSVLRLAVKLPGMSSGSHDKDAARSQAFLRSFILHIRASDQGASQDDLTYAINTVIYLALHDTAYPHREGCLLGEAGDTSYWLSILTDILVSTQLNTAAYRQVCWAVCVLAAERHWRRAAGDIIIPRIPRLLSIRPLLSPLKLLLNDHDQDPEAFTAVIIAIERMLSHATSGATETAEKAHLRNDLQPAYTALIGTLHDNLRDGKLSSAWPLAETLVPLTRIGVDLWKASLRKDRLETFILPILDIFSLITTSLSIPGNKPLPFQTRGLDSMLVLGWVFRATCSITTLGLVDGHREESRVPGIPFRLADATPVHTVASQFVSAIRQLDSVAPAEALPSHPIPNSLCTRFSKIMACIFTRAVPIDIVTAVILRDGLRGMLSASQRLPEIWTELFVPALNFIYDTLFHLAPHPLQDASSVKADPARHITGALLDQHLNAKLMQLVKELIRQRPMAEDERGLEILMKILSVTGWLAVCNLPYKVWPDRHVVQDFLFACIGGMNEMGKHGNVSTLRTLRLHVLAIIARIDTAFFGDIDAEENYRRDLNELGSERTAIGLTHILAMTSKITSDGQVTRIQPYPHCSQCTITLLQAEGFEDKLARQAYNEMEVCLGKTAILTLWVLHTLWDDEHQDVTALRQSLIMHGATSLVRHLNECRVGWPTAKIAGLLVRQIEGGVCDRCEHQRVPGGLLKW